jgi:hypothetical protein
VDVLAWSGSSGPEQVWELPAGNYAGLPPTAHAGVPDRLVQEAVAYKGPGISWPQWARLLARRDPYHGRFTIASVPDGTDIAAALAYLRRQAGLFAL